MDFKKKMKQRLCIAVSYCVLGLILIISHLLYRFTNQFIFSFGFALIALGIVRIVQYRRISRNQQTMHQREIAESDERTLMMAERARSWAFSFSIMIAGIGVIVLSVLGYHDFVQPLAWFVSCMVALYWACWIVIRKKY